MTIHPVAIIGSGPAGFTAGIYAARADLFPVLIEGSVTSGGALMNTTDVENFPGFPEGIMGPQLMQALREQAERFGTSIHTDDVVSVALGQSIKTLTLGSGKTLQSHCVILAMGSGYRELGLPREKEFSGRGVSWCATCDGFFFRDQDIAVVGGGDSAMEEAIFLSRFARTVTVIVRRDQLRASPIMQQRARSNPAIRFTWNARVTQLHGEQKLDGVTVTHNDGSTRDLTVTGLFIAIGHDPRSTLVSGQVELDDQGYILVQGRSTHTSSEGVFACGDVVDHTYRQAITAAGSGCSAALDAQRYLADKEITRDTVPTSSTADQLVNASPNKATH